MTPWAEKLIGEVMLLGCTGVFLADFGGVLAVTAWILMTLLRNSRLA